MANDAGGLPSRSPAKSALFTADGLSKSGDDHASGRIHPAGQKRGPIRNWSDKTANLAGKACAGCVIWVIWIVWDIYIPAGLHYHLRFFCASDGLAMHKVLNDRFLRRIKW